MDNIYTRLANINKKVEAIGKNKKNTQQNFKYRGIDDVMTELHGLFAENEVIITQKVLNKEREERPSKSGGINIWSIVTYEFTFSSPDGTSLKTEMVGEAMDSGDKGNNKCVSIALKYALIDLFLIPTEEGKESDPDANSPVALKSIELAPELVSKLKTAKTTQELAQMANEMKNSGVSRIAITPHFNAIKSALEAKTYEAV